jgi:hypothetical protein
MEKNLILLPTRSDRTQPAPKRPLILCIGGKRYQIRIDANITPVRDQLAEIIPIDRRKRSEG